MRALTKLRDRRWIVHHTKMALSRGGGNLGLVLRRCLIMAERFVGPLRLRSQQTSSTLSFSVAPDVDVSIIVPGMEPLERNPGLSRVHLAIHERNTLRAIVVDDCSTDETSGMMTQFEGVVYFAK